MGGNEQDLLRMVKLDNDTAISKMVRATDNPACDARHSPLAEGIARSIRVQEITLEHMMAGNGNGKPKDDSDDRKFAGVSVGKWKFVGVPAVIISVFIGISVLQYVHTKTVATEVKEEATTEAALVARTAVMREQRSVDRDAIAATIRDEMAKAIEGYIKEHK